tara:strand:- start:2 stop:520 length:519 start_codon:yes stop_codon:yes gene_type:complete
MAKTDSFFLRHSIECDNSGTFVQEPIDLGAYVDALGKSVLRIHNIAVAVTDSSGNAAQVQASVDSAAAQFQITTQTQTDTVLPSNKSVVSSGIVYAQNSFSNDEFPLVSHDMDNLPQLWSNGYLIAVDTIYLGGECSSGWVAAEDMTISVIMECTVETLNKEAAMALALSQQ